MNEMQDCIVIGGGQAGLSAAYFLRRAKLNFLILDKQAVAGGAWQHTWDSLRLFSTAQFSSLSGWSMPKSKEEYPPKEELIQYLDAYEKKYDFPIKRSVEVQDVSLVEEGFKMDTNQGIFKAKTIISATGTWDNPYIPDYPGNLLFKGQQIHSAHYKNPENLSNKKVLIVGGGNSAAQILAEVSLVAKTTWVTLQKPEFLPDEVDGYYLFNQANARYAAIKKGLPPPKPHSLASIVVVDSVKAARERANVLDAVRPFKSFYEDGVVWEDGRQESFDVVIWCTGFKASLGHLESLKITDKQHRIQTQGCRSIQIPNLWLMGYGNWTGYASATLYGVGKTARDAVKEIQEYLDSVTLHDGF